MYYVQHYSSYVACLLDGVEMLNCDSDGNFLVRDDSPTSKSEGTHLA